MFIFTGVDAKNMITDKLVAQDIYLGKDAVKLGGMPGTLVDDASTAEIEAKIIALHTDGEYGMYSTLERGDPNRATIIKGLTLRDSLNMAGYGLRNLQPSHRDWRGDRPDGRRDTALRDPDSLPRQDRGGKRRGEHGSATSPPHLT